MRASNRILLVLIAAVLPGLMTPAAHAQGRKPDRDDLPPVTLTQAQKDTLVTAWKDQKRPSISLFVGYYDKGPDFRGTPLENQLRSSIQALITEAGLTNAIVLPDSGKLRDAQALDAIEGNKAPETHRAIARMIARQDNRAQLAIIVLVQSAGDSTANVSMELHNLRNDRMIASKQFIPIAETRPPLEEVLKFATAIVVNFTEGLVRNADEARHGRPIHLRIIGLRDNEQADDMVSLIEARDGVSGVQHSTDRQGQTTLAEFEVFYNGETRTLVRGMREALKAGNQSLRQIETKDDRVLAEVLSSARPAWCRLTDADQESFAATVDARRLATRKAGSPRVAVVVGSDLMDPVVEFTNPQFEKELGAVAFRNDELAGQIADWMTRLGFEVVNSDSLRDRIRGRVEKDDRFADAAGIAEALRSDLPGFDCVAYVNISPDYRGPGFRYTAQLISWNDSVVVGAQRWPDPGFDAFDECRIDPQDVNDVARYLVGNLVERWDTFTSRREKHRTLQVIVKGLDDAAQLCQIADLFRAIPEVDAKGVDRIVVSGAVGGFDLAIRGRPGPIVDKFRAQRDQLAFPVAIEGQSEVELVLNLGKPEPAPTSRGEGPAKPIAIGPGRSQTNLYAILIGVNYTGDRAGISPLSFCVADAKLMQKTLIERCGVPADHVIMMTDDLPESSEYFPDGRNILAQVEALSRRIRPGDRVLIHFSGHGSTTTDETGNAIVDHPSLCARSFQQGGKLVVRHPKLQEIRDMLRRVQASEVILFIDACHSGSAGVGLAGAPGTAKPDARDVFLAALAANNQSMITLAGSRLNQYSQESPEHQHGYFTYFVAEGLSGKADSECGDNDLKVTFDELYRYAFKRVSAETKGNQQPFMSAAVIDIPVLADYSK